jgi:2-phosphosulfolactate phosphatase
MKKVEVCLSPDLIHLFDLKGKIVVVTDILRATSCMTTALAHGVASIIPVASLDECREYGKKGYLTAAERDGKREEGFDLGNSPFGYMNPDFKGKTIVLTTTNGTKAIVKAEAAHEILIGSFLNLDTICNYLLTQSHDVVIICSGWKGHANMEDTLFAGAVGAKLRDNGYLSEQDSTDMSIYLYIIAENKLEAFLANCSHSRRLQNLDITDDIAFCLTLNKYDVLPVMENGRLVTKVLV